jgi:hypothetical protein
MYAAILCALALAALVLCARRKKLTLTDVAAKYDEL